MTNEPMGGMTPEEWFVLGGIPNEAGSPEGHVVDIDADPESEAGERTRIVKPYRWWTAAVAFIGVAGIAFGVWQTWAVGLADFGGNGAVSVAVPVSAISYDDGTVEVQMRSIPVRDCPGGAFGDCTPNQVEIRWVDAGATLEIAARMTSPVSESLAMSSECSAESGQTSVNGTITVKSPSGAAPTKVVSYLDGRPADLIVSRTPPNVPLGTFLGAPGTCNSLPTR